MVLPTIKILSSGSSVIRSNPFFMKTRLPVSFPQTLKCECHENSAVFISAGFSPGMRPEENRTKRKLRTS